MYRLAFVGGGIGSIAGYPHFIASQMDRRFEVVAGVFSRNPVINKKTALRWNIANCYETFESLITDRDGYDAIVVLVPTPQHFKILKELLIRKIPIICEKPLVGSLEEAQEIRKLYTRENFLVVANNYSGYPMIRELQQSIINKKLGDILSIRLKMPQESFLRPPKNIKYPQKWRLKDGFIPMISLDLGSHLHHLSYFLLQEEPNKVNAIYANFSKYNVVDDVNIFLEYQSGVKGNIWFSKTALGNRNGLHIEIYGSKASAIWHQENPEKLTFAYNTGQRVIIDRGSNVEMIPNRLYNRMIPGHPAGFIESFANLYNDIANALDSFRAKKACINRYVYGLEHAYNGIKLFHNASISNKNRNWQTISTQ